MKTPQRYPGRVPETEGNETWQAMLPEGPPRFRKISNLVNILKRQFPPVFLFGPFELVDMVF